MLVSVVLELVCVCLERDVLLLWKLQDKVVFAIPLFIIRKYLAERALLLAILATATREI